MAEKTNAPEIRFEGFTDPWEQRKLGELCTISKGHGYSKADIRDVGTPLILYGRLYTQYESRIEDVDTFVVGQEGSLLSKGNEVIVPASGETAEDIAVASSVRRPGIIFGGDLNVVTPVRKLDPDYTALAITYSKAHDDLAKRAQGKSVVHVHGNDIAEVEVSYPSESEQKRISTVVLGLDNLITLHQRKYDKLCTVKKSMLDKMFPKPGETEPEIRFEGFTDPWEQRKLGDITSSYSGGTPQANNPDYYNGSIPFIRSAEINADKTELYLTERGLAESSAALVDAGCILYALYGATSGEAGISRINGAINQAILAICPYAGFDSGFLASWLRREKDAIVATYLQGGQGNLSGAIVKDLRVPVPGLPEQKAIGDCLSKLDDLITLHRRKLNILKNTKKSLLDKMFV